jgi:hypothetical protein
MAAMPPNQVLVDALLQDMVQALGFSASRSWLTQLIASPAGAEMAAAATCERRVALLLGALMDADLNEAGAGGLLPPNIQVGLYLYTAHIKAVLPDQHDSGSSGNNKEMLAHQTCSAAHHLLHSICMQRRWRASSCCR